MSVIEYSDNVKYHLSLQTVSEDYILTQEFTLDELRDICQAPTYLILAYQSERRFMRRKT